MLDTMWRMASSIADGAFVQNPAEGVESAVPELAPGVPVRQDLQHLGEGVEEDLASASDLASAPPGAPSAGRRGYCVPGLPAENEKDLRTRAQVLAKQANLAVDKGIVLVEQVDVGD